MNGVPGSASLKDLHVHNGPAFRGRIGFWLKTHLSVGVAIDAAHFDTDIDNQVAQLTISPDPVGASRILGTPNILVSNTLVTFDLILRHHSVIFTPYILAGPGLMFSNLGEGGFFGNNVQNEAELEFSYKVGVGISYKISDNMHLITEYPYMHGSSEYTLDHFRVIRYWARTPFRKC